MIRTTPFHPRLSEFNLTGLWSHWAGHLSAQKYDMSAKHEYFAVRNSVGLFDTSPLYKYWIRGRDAERFLAGVLTRDVRTCRPGRAQYTVWSDDAGYVMEDGVVFRHSDTEFFLTAAEPNLAYFQGLIGRLQVTVEDVTDAHGILAVQGPRSRTVLAALAPEVSALPFFGLTQAKIAGAPVTVSRTGFIGDLGYEILVDSDAALGVLDAVLAAGRDHAMRPFGEQALSMARVEAGLVLIGVEFSSSRLAFSDHDRITPAELGLGWMLRGVATDGRPFIGRDAIRRELAGHTSRWATVGVVVDWAGWNRVHRDAGLIPPKDEIPVEYESMLYDEAGERVGFATSLMYSPMLQRHIGIARVRPDFSAPGSRVQLEVTVNHSYVGVPTEVARMPLFNPERKTA